MAKKKQKKRNKKVEKRKEFFWEKLTIKQQYGLCIAFIFLTIILYFAPIVFQNKVPPSTDIIAWKGNAHSILEAKKEYDYTPLWANNIFSGMPAYLISVSPPFEQPARYLINWLGKVIDWRSVYFLIGAVGMILLVRFFNGSILAGGLAGLAFIWWPQLLGLFEAGHNSKVQTIMMMPLILFTFLLFLRKANLLNITFFTIAFSLGVRAGHYQIMFYTGLAMLFFGTAYLITLIQQKERKGISIRAGLTIAALVLAVAMSAFPSMLIREYSKYSIRGGTGEKGSTGLSFDYATSWSLHPAEMFTFLIPNFYGGSSSQTYEGDKVPQLKGRTIPGYWGHMPFTSTTDYMGIVIIFLAAIALLFRFKNRWVLTSTILIVFALLMAYGRHFPLLYKLFFNYFPFFNKFRVPGMIVVLVHLSTVIMAAFGFDILFYRMKEQLSEKTIMQRILAITGILIFIGLIPFFFRNSFAFVRPQEISQYRPEVLNLLKTARYDLMFSDATRLILLTIISGGIIIAFVKKWLSKSLFLLLIFGLLLFDLFSIDKRFMKNLVREDYMDNQFTKKPITDYLQQETSQYRIFPLGELFGDAYWSYWHQSIGGYHPAKLRIYQDIIESCLYQGKAAGFQNSPQVPINWNVVNMLNAKYILAKGRIEHPNLSLGFTDQDDGILAYKNQTSLPRVFSVDSIEVIPDRQARFARLNDATFDPAQIAILEKEPTAAIGHPTQWQADITRYEPNYIDVSVSTDGQTLLVLSEIYYPAGWKAFIDGQQTEILKTNHILRSVIVPPGNHNVEFTLEPQTYTTSVWIMGTSILIVYLVLGVAVGLYYRRGKGGVS